MMDVKQAVKTAADYVASLESMTDGAPADEPSSQALQDMHFAIEGTHYDEGSGRWRIEVGFARPWDKASASPLVGISGAAPKDNRTFKTVTIDDATGRVLAYGSN